MKRIISILLFCSCCQFVICQNTWQKDSAMYMNAYLYIINDSINKGMSFAVSDSIVDLDKNWFLDQLTDFPIERQKLDEYRLNKKYIWDEPVYSPLLASLFPRKEVKSPQTIVFFSTIFEGPMLRVDLNFFKKTRYSSDLRYPGRIVESGMDVADRFKYSNYIFGESYIYLFLFNENGSIYKVWRSTLILN